MNRYQTVLNCIKKTQVNFTDFGAFDLLEDFLPNDWIDTLQELIDNYKQLKNEFCLQCGKYKNEHLGACKGCKWHDGK